MRWTVKVLRAAAKEVSNLPSDLSAQFIDTVRNIEAHGIETVDTKSIGKGLYEIRLWAKSGTARALYVQRVGTVLLVVLVFAKKTQKTPAQAIETALKRAKTYREE